MNETALPEVFRLGQALAAGHTRARLDGRRKLRTLERVRHGVYAESHLVQLASLDEARAHALRAEAAVLRLHGDPVISHESAALLHGIATLGRHARSAVQITRPRQNAGARRYPGVIVRRCDLPPEQRAPCPQVAGLELTSAARTLVDIARLRDFRAGVVAVDSALHRNLCTRADLLKVLDACAQWPNARRARRVIQFADGNSESPLESISRVAFHEHGVPRPQVQAQVLYDRVDFLWVAQKVVGEADGLSKYSSRDDLQREKARQDGLEAYGYEVVRWTWKQAYANPVALADRIQDVLNRRT